MRLMLDPRLPGSRNMAVDKALLESAAQEGFATLRIYGWLPATISLGYFQNWDSRSSHKASADCPVVRRASGGGAICHDHELTYSIALPASDSWANRNRDLFDGVHQSLISCLEGMSVSGCEVFRNAERESKESPFLCFQRRANGDVVIGNDKVIGSAQRRLQSALLQHGSVLVKMSDCAPELPGILDICPDAKSSVERLSKEWPGQLAEAMGWQLELAELTEKENIAADRIESEVFGNPAWNRKR